MIKRNQVIKRVKFNQNFIETQSFFMELKSVENKNIL